MIEVKKKPKKKSRRKQLENKLDKLFSQYIRLRDKRCYTCGTSDDVLQCGHLITRARKSVRWDERNAYCQCRSCNLIHEHRPEIFTNRWIQDHGAESYDKLVADSWECGKFTYEQLESMIEAYQDAINSLAE